jgi:hypothetical protein
MEYQRCFLVVVHDVTPLLVRPLTTILETFAPLVARRITAAVVPCWHNQPGACAKTHFAAFLIHHFQEVILHGYTHQRERGAGLVSALTAGADEFAGLTAAAAVARVRRGQEALCALTGVPAAGFVAPAWQRGRLSPDLLAACGIDWYVGMMAIVSTGGTQVRLATWSWDTGRFAHLGALGEAFGVLTYALRRRAVPCVVLHPADVSRGSVVLGQYLVRTFLAQGRRPASFGELIAKAGIRES